LHNILLKKDSADGIS